MPVRQPSTEEPVPWEEDVDEAPVRKKKRRSTRSSVVEEAPEVVVVEEDQFDDEDEDDFSADSSVVQTGWDAARQAKSQASTGIFFKVDEQPQLVKFIKPDKLLTYKQHWVDEVPGKKKSFICGGKGCPICKRGHSPYPRYVFTVLNLSQTVPMVQRLEATLTLLKQIEPLNEDRRTGPLDRHYYAVSATSTAGSNKKVWSIVPTKERDLEEDWDIDPDVAKDYVEDARPFTGRDIVIPKLSELQEAAAFIPK